MLFAYAHFLKFFPDVEFENLKKLILKQFLKL